MLDFKIASGDFYEIPDLDKGTLRFKNAAWLFLSVVFWLKTVSINTSTASSLPSGLFLHEELE